MNIILSRQSVFIFGFLIGLIIVLLYKYGNHILMPTEFHKDYWRRTNENYGNWYKLSEKYNEWRQSQNVYVSKVDKDELFYGRKLINNYEGRNVILESEWLKSKVLVTCVVFVKKVRFVAAIKDTWGKHCNHLLFFSHAVGNNDLPVIRFRIKFTSSWQLLCEVMNYIWKNKNNVSLDWLIFVNDDTYVVTENLRYVLAPLNFKEAYYLGHPIVLWGLAYNVAQAGYVLSYGALQKVASMFSTSEKCAASGKYWAKEDYYLGKHLASQQIYPLDTRDSKQRGIFHEFPLNTLLWRVAKPDSYYTKALYPPEPQYSDRSVTFNVGDADKMYTIHYLLHHLHIFERGIYGNKPVTNLILEDEVWKSVLHDEFNLTNVDNISSAMYFEIWRKKYSEPEKFIAAILGNNTR